MKKRRRPAGSVTGAAKANLMKIRVTAAEKHRYRRTPLARASGYNAAALDGKDLSAWARDRLRRLGRHELEQAGRPVAFLKSE
ncbi:MAG: hypothetical protein E6K70_18185 [Planctomycetota bacterium]|nr:MAG: hypothetical protein E6K70_18185 [Planctomycetota bacterium]